MTQRPKILLLIPHLGGGGAEQVTSLLAQYLDHAQFEVHLGLVTKDSPGAPRPPRCIRVHRLDLSRVRLAVWALLRLIWEVRPAVVLSGMAHLNFLILMLRPILPLGTTVIVRQNSTASCAQSLLTRSLYRWLYPLADAIICQSKAMADDFAEHFSILQTKLSVLANPIDFDTIRNSAKSPAPQPNWPANSHPKLLCVGRLAYEKGMDILFESLVSVRNEFPKVHLLILGTGPEQVKLLTLCRQLGLERAVTFAGYANDPALYYSDASLFVLPSRNEGMPNVLLEAAVAGLPIAATPCCKGVSELLSDVPGVWLASEISAKALSEVVVSALRDITSKADTNMRFQHTFLSPFELRTAVKAYEGLLNKFIVRAQA